MFWVMFMLTDMMIRALKLFKYKKHCIKESFCMQNIAKTVFNTVIFAFK